MFASSGERVHIRLNITVYFMNGFISHGWTLLEYRDTIHCISIQFNSFMYGRFLVEIASLLLQLWAINVF